MGFLNSIVGLFDSSGGGDPLEAHPELGPIITAGKKRDSAPAQALFAATRGRWDVRLWAVELTSDHYFMSLPKSSRDSLIESLVQQGELGWLLARGAWHMSMGWAARGTGGADTVSQAGWDELARRCDLAEADLMSAAERDPQDPTGYTLMLRLARGRGDRDLGEEMYAKAIERDPAGYEPHRRFLEVVSGRWMGSHEEMLSLAREISARAPDGSDAASLPIEAHFDRYSHMCYFDEDYNGACRYLCDRSVQAEVTEALARSVDAPGYQLTPATMKIRHCAAAVLLKGGSFSAAKAQLAKVGKTFYKTAWWPNEIFPGKAYKAARSQVGL